MSDRIKLFGTDEPPAASRLMTAGPLSVEFVSGGLRAIRFRGHEVLRAIAYVVRDRDWGTYDPPIEDLTIEEERDRFNLRFEAACEGPDGARLRYRARIAGEASGQLSFDVEALPSGAFETNRCGFCVLHPIEHLAGTAAEVEHVDGSLERSAFPDLIEPWQPFKDIRALTHEIAPGVRATCRMEGDIFEMEDQRAWSDASYKTYVRPLALPWPYRMASGVVERQAVTLTITGDAAALQPAAIQNGVIDIALGDATGETLPRFGLAVAPEEAEAALAGLARLKAIAPQYLLFHFDPLAGHGVDDLKRFASIAAECPEAGIALEFVLPARGDLDAECQAGAQAIREAGLRLDTLVVGPDADRGSTPPGSAWPDCPPLANIYAAARRAFPGVRLGGGMFSYFTELNRKRVPLEPLDFVTHATCPIVHAADDRSVMETLEAIPFITRSTRAFIGDKPYRLGPTTIGMRQNPYGSRIMPNPGNKRVPMAADDPRGRGLFGAAWAVGYAARLEGSGVEAWCGASLAGPRGLILGNGRVAPLFHVASGLARAAGDPRIGVTSSDRRRVDGYAHRDADRRSIVWLANLTPEPQTIRLPGRWRHWVLDEASFAEAASGEAPVALEAGDTIPLGPHAVVRLVSLGASRSGQDA
ncbi:hypothetical protein NS365_05790 [Aureimonas ureilytica]|uniref:Uncharacterized protein n=1 Tax=Aureimonas ureilytica TaxID=401562 RepID=A0A175RT00_9HYPH|nr:hypothetical protein [Aureimonas ureilytica]KTR06935.1 hypothetical protein NS365_05790 [Aureimonas ureilytica]